MFQENLFKEVNNHLGQILKNHPLQDFEQNIKAIVSTVFAKLDLVTREEFDTQQKVLLATRMKLEDLEAKLKTYLDNKQKSV